MIMGVRERILTIRLMEKLQAHTVYAKALGIEMAVSRPAVTDEKKEK